jgi:hypothetical protein
VTVEVPQDALDEYGDLWGTMQYISDTLSIRYAAAGLSLPERKFTAVGDVASSLANDCEQVTINFVQAYLGVPGQPDVQARGCELPMSADFVIQVTRCVPTPKESRGAGRPPTPPTVAAIEASTVVQAVDAQILLESAYSMSSVQGISATVAPSGVEGGYQSVALSLAISLFRA